jgi:predicted nucleotidyltransferase
VVAVEFDFERLRPALAEICLRYGIVELAVFGSFARADVDPSSDVDILYVRAPGNDLGVDYFDLQDELERLFGRPVDLVPKEGLHWIVRDEVLAEARELYAAA